MAPLIDISVLVAGVLTSTSSDPVGEAINTVWAAYTAPSGPWWMHEAEKGAAIAAAYTAADGDLYEI